MILNERRYDMDWLRTISVLLVIPFHSLLIFNMQPESIVYVKDVINVPLFNSLDSIIDRFHMPLLFVLAGMAAYYALKIKGRREYLRERCIKLFIPLLFGLIVLNPLMTYLWMQSNSGDSTLLQHYIHFFTANPGDFTGVTGGFTPAHLWFILYLLIFSFVLLPVFPWVQKLAQKSAGILSKPFMLFLFVVPAALLGEIDLLDDKNPFVYAFIYGTGFFLASDECYQKALNRDKWGYLLLSVCLIYIKLFTAVFHQAPDTVEWVIHILFQMTDKATRILPAFALVGLFSSYVNKSNKLLTYLSAASFTVYVVHMLVNTVMGFLIVKLPIHYLIKYLLIVLSTFLISFAIYEVVYRNQVLSYLFGAKNRRTTR